MEVYTLLHAGLVFCLFNNLKLSLHFVKVSMVIPTIFNIDIELCRKQTIGAFDFVRPALTKCFTDLDIT